MNNFAKMSAIALVATLIVGCGSDEEDVVVEETMEMTDTVSSSASDLIKEVRAARAAAERASADARTALDTANANQRAIDELNARVSKGVARGMQK